MGHRCTCRIVTLKTRKDIILEDFIKIESEERNIKERKRYNFV